MRLIPFSMTWRKFLSNPVLAIISWWFWRMVRGSYGVEIEERRVRLFPLSHIVLTDYDLREWE